MGRIKMSKKSENARRPIKVRDSRWAKAAAGALVHVGLRPNVVSILSMVFASGAATCLVLSANAEPYVRGTALVAAAILVQLRLLCNLLDGLMAIEGGLKSSMGEVYNDLPDRVSDILILIGAGYADSALQWSVELGWTAALLAILTAYVRVLGAATGAPHDFRGPMAKQHRMNLIAIACMVAAFEPSVNLRGHVMFAALAVLCAGCILTIFRRLAHISCALRSLA